MVQWYSTRYSATAGVLLLGTDPVNRSPSDLVIFDDRSDPGRPQKGRIALAGPAILLISDVIFPLRLHLSDFFAIDPATSRVWSCLVISPNGFENSLPSPAGLVLSILPSGC